MQRFTRPFSVVALLLALFSPAHAEDGVLVVHVSKPNGQPIAGVILSTKGDSSTTAPTSREGKARIRLAPQTKPNSEVTLQIVRPLDWVFISPWDSRVRVPPFDNDSQNFVSLVLVERGDKAMLEYDQVILAVAAKISAASAPTVPNDIADLKNISRVAPQSAVLDVISYFGLRADEIDEAIRKNEAKTNDPYKKGIYLLYSHKYAEATQQFLNARAEHKNKPHGPQWKLAEINAFLGHSLFREGKFREAADIYMEAVRLSPDNTHLLTQGAAALSQIEDYAGAQRLLRRALDADESNLRSDDIHVATTARYLALLYIKQGNFSEAGSTVKRVAHILERKQGSNTPELGYLLNIHALSRLFEENSVEAESLLQRAINISEQPVGREIYLAESLNTLALYKYVQGKQAEAEQILKRSRHLLQKVMLENQYKSSVDWDLTLDGFINNIDLSVTLYNRHQAGRSEAFIRRTMMEIEKVPEPMLSFLTIVLNLHLEAAYQAWGPKFERRDIEAEMLLLRTIPLIERSFGLEHPLLANTFVSLAAIYNMNKEYAEAESFLQRGLQVAEKAYGADHPVLLEVLLPYALNHQDMNKYDAAENTIKRGIAIINKHFGVDSPKLVDFLEQYYFLLRKLKRVNEADQVETRIRVIQTKHPQTKKTVKELIIEMLSEKAQ